MSVSKDSGVDSFHEIFNGILDKHKDIFLRALRRQDIVKFHVGMVARSSYLKRIILDNEESTPSRLTNMLGSSSLRIGLILMMILSLS